MGAALDQVGAVGGGAVVLGRRPAARPARRLLAGAARWKTFTLGLTLILVFVLAAIFAPFVAPHDPAKPNYRALLHKPRAGNLFGTDDKGRDIFSRVVYGTRVSFTIAVVAVSLATLIGVPLGLLAGFFGGWIDTAI